MLTPLHVAGMTYFAFAFLAGSAFLAYGFWGFAKKLGERWARKLFLFSIAYLAAVFLVISVDRVMIA
jgi:heme O synthase-like polyprenyltransferase